MKAIDVFFGKRVSGSFYHVNTTYLNRYEMNDESNVQERMSEILKSSIDEILTQDLPDEVQILLNKLKESDFTDSRSVNEITSVLSNLGYEVRVILRNDIESTVELDGSIARSYAMNKRITGESIGNINIFQIGLCSVFDDSSQANLNSMVMEFLVKNVINLDEENASLIKLNESINDYDQMDKNHESYLMDTSDILHMLEEMDYEFFLLMPTMNFA